VAEAIKALFQHYVIFPARVRGKDAEEISDLIGEMTEIQSGLGVSKSGVLGNATHSQNWRTATTKMLSVEQMSVFPDHMAVVIPMGGRPMKVYMPRLDETHCDGQPNPFHQYEKLIWGGMMKPLKWIEAYLAAMERGEIKSAKPSGTAETHVRPEDLTGIAKGRAVRDEYLKWMADVIEHRPEIKILSDGPKDKKGKKDGKDGKDEKPKEVTEKERHAWKVQLSIGRLPQELKDVTMLKRFHEQRWISDSYATSNTHFAILPAGKRVMSEDLVARFHMLAYLGYSATWEHEHAPRLKGHPDFDSTLKGQPEGFWQEGRQRWYRIISRRRCSPQTPDKITDCP